MLGTNRVPVTVSRSLNGEPGSLQAWVDDAFSERERFEDKIPLEAPQNYAAATTLMQGQRAMWR